MKITTYKANKFYGFPALLIPLLLLPPLLNSEVSLENRLVGFVLFLLITLIIILIPLGARLDVGDDFVRTRLFGFRLLELHPSNIQVMTYGNLFRGGLGYGKGLNIRAIIKGKSRSTSIGEKLYGEEAVAHAKRVLER
jgi:hypothetical protein